MKLFLAKDQEEKFAQHGADNRLTGDLLREEIANAYATISGRPM
jgi:hypothetical protein